VESDSLQDQQHTDVITAFFILANNSASQRPDCGIPATNRLPAENKPSLPPVDDPILVQWSDYASRFRRRVIVGQRQLDGAHFGCALDRVDLHGTVLYRPYLRLKPGEGRRLLGGCAEKPVR